MNSSRSYGQYCALARALDLVGERWTLLIVRELLLGPRRFTDVKDHLPGIGTSLLSERLKHLERSGLAHRRRLPPPAASTVYELTPDGLELGLALLPLAIWGAKRLGARAPGEVFHIEWLMLALRGVLDGTAAEGTWQVELDGETLTIRADRTGVDVSLGAADGPDAVIRGDVESFVGAWLAGGRAKRRIHVDGDASGLFGALRPQTL